MPDDIDSSIDLVGAGKLAKAIPPKAWEQLVRTACETFTRCMAPITATTSGVARLIDAWFDKLVDAQKVLAAETVLRATKKVLVRFDGAAINGSQDDRDFGVGMSLPVGTFQRFVSFGPIFLHKSF